MLDPTSRLHIRHDFSGLTIEIPAPRQWFSIVFLTIWMAGWTLGEVFAVKTLFQTKQIAVQLFMAVWLTGWTIGGLGALYQIIWQLVGLEIITVEHQTLTIARNTPVWTRSKAYEIPQITNIRLVEAEQGFNWEAMVIKPGRRSSPTDRGRIQFDYQLKTIKFGQSLTAKEAHQVLTELKESPKLDDKQFGE